MSLGLAEFGIAVAAHLGTDAAKAGVKKVFSALSSSHPELNERAKAAQVASNTLEVERIFQEAVGVIIAEADSGQISVESSAIAALRGIKFDHQHGTVQIGKSTLKATVLITGGGVGATGQTTISGNTTLASQGTSIRVGDGASIVMTGGAFIKQT